MAGLARFLCLNGGAAAKPTPPTNDDGPPPSDIPAQRAELSAPAGDWFALLDPLDAGLRDELLKYGDLAQATYDGFDGRHWSPHCGTCLHGLRRLLPALGLAGHGYVATAFIYATCDGGAGGEVPRWLRRQLHADAWTGHANWIGFVAVSGAAEARRAGGYRDIVVAWRGTIAPDEWLLDMRTRMVPFELDAGKDRGARVAMGFHSIYTSSNAGNMYGDAADAHPGVPVAAVAFAAPRVGNAAFCAGLASRGVRVLRVAVRHDVVPLVPSVPRVVLDAPVSKALAKLWAAIGRPPSWAYVHAGDELELDVKGSPFLKHAYDVLGFHNLETCLHLLDVAGGGGGGARRDRALVNKTSGMLRDEERVPAWWYLPENKGLVRNELGRWVVAEREEDDLPVPDDRLPLSELD